MIEHYQLKQIVREEIQKILEKKTRKEIQHILKETEEDQIDISALNDLDDEIKKELENAPKNEIIGTLAFGLTALSIINIATKIIERIARKNGLQLEKQNNKWYQVLGNMTEKIEGLIIKPISFVLKLVIDDQIKRDKAARIITSVTLALTAIYAGVGDIKQIESTTSLIKDLTPELGSDLIQAITSKNKDKIVDILKPIFGV
jgi:hypothetical protein